MQQCKEREWGDGSPNGQIFLIYAWPAPSHVIAGWGVYTITWSMTLIFSLDDKRLLIRGVPTYTNKDNILDPNSIPSTLVSVGLLGPANIL